MTPSHLAMWLDQYLMQAWSVLTDVHGWLLVGWLGFSLVVALVVGGDAK